jgi:hypothetical protein
MLNLMETPPILEKIIDAHGGRGLWERLHAIEAEISARGLLFTLKRRPVLDHVRMTAMAHEPRFLFHDHPSPGMTGELAGNDEVRILDSDGRVVERRSRHRDSMGGLNKLFRWDALDFIYFGGYATWNYLVTPFLLLDDRIRVEALKPPAPVPSTWACLRAHFPETIPTHSPTQTYYFDERLQLRRLDYVAEVVGSWAHAAHLCEDYRDFDGFKAPARRRVHPIILGNRVLPGPTLVALDIHRLRPVSAGA